MIVIKNKTARSIIKIAVPFVMIPSLVLLSAFVFREKRYLIISFGIAVLSVILFAAGFEKKKIGSRRLVTVSVLTAMCIVGRFIPFFKPVAAITIITGMYLGGESGFLVGSLSAMLSNFYFGQGPWTPFQMLAWGFIGLIAGFLSKPLIKSRVFLLTCGCISGVFFSLIMDMWSVIWYSGSINIEMYISAVMLALPHTVLYAVSNFAFLWLTAKPIGEKIERVKIKYGI